ncbi:MAG TPA: PqqD family protein [Armatimonadota bacterium]|nr:PqqD family protein [Armatimonadota bacterium]
MGAVYNIVAQYLPFVRKKPVLTRDQALRTRPFRNPAVEWERGDEGEIRLLIPRRKDLVGRALARAFRAAEHREIALDDVGSDIWELCDGEHSLEAIVYAVSKKYKMTRRECEASVSAFLKTLGERRLLGFQVGGRRKK